MKNDLVNRYINLAYKIADYYAIYFYEYKEDLESVAVLALIKAVEKFEDRGKSPTTYFMKSIRTGITNELRRITKYNKSKKINPNYNYIYQPHCRQNIEAEEILNILQLPSKDEQILFMRMDDYTYKEIAQVTNMSIENVKYILNRIKKNYLKLKGAKKL